jgi:cytochrome c-type biogenesis protein CcmF
MIQEKRGMLKVWNVSLILGSGTLAILGTFLVRSGVLDSIHAFGASTLGIPFVVLLAVMIIGAISLVVWRRPMLRSDAQLDSLLSREAVFLFQNLVLVAMVFVIFWVTFFPLISEAVTGTKVSVGPPAFRPFIVPLALILVLLSGIGPIIAWRRVTVANLRRNFVLPVLVGLATLIVLVLVTDAASRPLALCMFVFGAFVLATVVQELWRGTAARRALTRDSVPVAFAALIRRNRRRYGGYIAHAGLAVLLIGVAASSSFQHSHDVVLSPGQTTKVDGYTIRYVRPTEQATDAKISFGAVLDVAKGGRHVGTLTTTRGFYPATFDNTVGPISIAFDGQSDSQVGLKAGLLRDIWTVINPNVQPIQSQINRGDQVFERLMTSLTPAELRQSRNLQFIQAERARAIEGLAGRFVTHPWPVEFLMIVSPLVTWIWLGAFIIALGGLIALWPVPVAARRRSAARSRASRGAAPALPVRETV